MKKNIFTFIAIFFVCLFFFGCEGLIDGNNQSSGFNSDGTVNVKFSFSVNSISRTALPSIDLDDLTYTLDAIKDYGSVDAHSLDKPIFSDKIYNEVKDGSSVPLEPANYKFILHGKRDNVEVITGVVIEDLRNGHRNICFNMYPVKGSTGSVRIDCVFPNDGVVVSAYGWCSNSLSDTHQKQDEDFLPISIEDDKARVSLTKADLQSGEKQYGVICLYDQSGYHVYSCAEGIIIVGGCESYSLLEITEDDYLSTPVSITLKLNDEIWKNSGKEIKLKEVGGTNEYKLKELDGVFTASVKDGNYDICIGDIKIGKQFDVSIVNRFETIDYYNVNVVPGEGTLIAADFYLPVLKGDVFPFTVSIAEGYETTSVKPLVVRENGAVINDVNLEVEFKDFIVTTKTLLTTDPVQLSNYTITYELDERNANIDLQEHWKDGYVATPTIYTFKTPVVLPSSDKVNKKGFILKGWKLKGTDDSTFITEFVPGIYSENLVFVPVWEDAGNGKFIINCRYQNTEDSSYSNGYSKEIVCHVDDVITLEKIKENLDSVPAGFKEPNISPVGFSIAKDIVQTVYVKYDRKNVTVILDPNNGTWGDATGTDNKELTGKYGASLKIPSLTKVEGEETFSLIGWKVKSTDEIINTLPSVFPSEDETYTAQWESDFVSYTVKHSFESLKDSSYVVDESKTQILNGKNKTNIKPLDVPGFTVDDSFEQVELIDDLVVVVKYNRKNITITFDPNGGVFDAGTINESTAPKDMTDKFGKNISSVSVPTKDGYAFDGWNPILPGSYPAENSTYTAKWRQTSANYTVKVYKQNIENDEYTLDSTNIKNGKIGSKTNETAPSIPGFEDAKIVQTVITADDRDVVEIRYDRKLISYTFSTDGGNWGDSSGIKDKVVTGKYEAVVITPNEDKLSKVDYEFAGWNKSISLTFGSSDESFIALWKKVSAEYKVIYEYQNIENDEYTENKLEQKILKGKVDEKTNVTANSVEGFMLKPIIQQTITSDDKTVVVVRYDRKRISVKYNPDGGVWSFKPDGTVWEKSGVQENISERKLTYTVEGKYGSPLPLPQEVTKEHYVLTGWTPSVPATFPSQDITIKAVWSLDEAKYTVRYYFQNIKDDKYTVDPNFDTEFFGKIGALSNAIGLSSEQQNQKADMIGFVLKTPITQKLVTQDGQTVIEVYYDRKIISYTFKTGGGTWGDATGTGDKIVSGKYGAVVVVPDTSKLVKTGYNYKGWDSNTPKTFGSTDVFTYTAVWGTDAIVDGFEIFTETGDIKLTKSATTGSYTFTVAVPHTGNWEFTWIIDDQRIPNVTSSSISRTIYNLGKGTHTVTVLALYKYNNESGDSKSALYTKTISVTVN